MHQELLKAVKERIELGYSHDAIKDELRSAGHSEETIDAVLLQAQAELHPDVAAIPVATADSAVAASAATSGMVELIGYGDLINQSWSLFKGQIGLFSKAVGVAVLLFIVLIVAIVSVVFGSVGTAFDPSNLARMAGGDMAMVLVGIFIAFLIMGLAFRVLGFAVLRNLTVRESAPETFTGSLKWTLGNIVPVIVLGLMVYCATQFGYVLLFLPGVALAVYLMFSSYVLARGEGRYLSAMVRSTELVYGRWWSVFGRMLVAGIVALLLLGGLVLATGLIGGALALGIGGFLSSFLLPFVFLLAIGYMVGFTYCVSVTLYESLQASYDPSRMTEKGKRNLRTFYLVAVVLGVFAAIFMQSSESVLDELLEAQTSADAAVVQQTLSTAAVQAELYYARSGNDSYEGVCGEIEPYLIDVAKYTDCVDSVDTWALSATANSGEQHCVDSAGGQVRGGVSVATGLCENSGMDDDAAAKDRANELRERDIFVPEIPRMGE